MSFLAELKRRRVVRVAAVYAATAFAVIQAADVIFPRVALPAWTVGLVVWLAILGFPVAVIMAWLFEVTPEGVRRTDSDGLGATQAAKRQRWFGPRALLGAGAMLLLGIGLGAGWFLKPAPEPAASAAAAATVATLDPRKVAVLPLRNANPNDPDNATLAVGVHDDLLTRLSQVRQLKVVSRTSVMDYADTRKSIRQIGHELGAGAILEGGVQRAGDQVRINVQLINAATDEHLWAQTYDRPWSLENLFGIQTEIAEHVALALEAALTGGERAALGGRPTNDEDAYQAYVRARDIVLFTSDVDELHVGIELLERAVARDSAFAQAWALLGQAHANLYWQHGDHTPERLAQARRAVDRAIELAPNLADSHRALGLFYYWGLLDYDRALAELEVARRLGGETAPVLAGIGFVRRRQGRMAEALEGFRRAEQLDPRNAGAWLSLAETLTLLRRYPEADTAFARMLELKPASEEGNVGRAFLQLLWRGDVAAAGAMMESAERMQVALDPGDLSNALQLELMVRGPRDILSRLQEDRDSLEVDDQFRLGPTDLVRAEALRLVGDSAAARPRYASAAAQLERAVRQRPSDERAWTALGLAYAGLGRKAEAIRAARKGVELLPVEREAWRGTYRLEELARVYARVGEPDRALDILEDLLRRPSDVSPALLRLDPAWEPLRSHERFRNLAKP